MDLTHFTPWSALLGGLLIGLAASLLAVFNGRIAGISGIAGRLFQRGSSGHSWRIAFLVGLLAAPWLLHALDFGSLLAIRAPSVSGPVLILAGLLVGIGTRLANGCTSGHGVCGLARLSPRSLVAVLVFMTTGFVTVWLLRHAGG